MRIGHITLANRLFAAPMAGVTDRPFRQLCKKLGAGYAVSEMVTSRRDLWNSLKTSRRADHDGEVAPIAVQIAGTDAAMMAEAAAYNIDRGAQVIDINMGCPAKKVCNKWAGSALMQDEPLALEIVEAVVAACAPRNVPVTLKMRTGWCAAERNAVRIARAAESAGVAMVTVHGRTREQGYKGEAEYDTIAAVKAAARDSRRRQRRHRQRTRRRSRCSMFAATGADALMIGRAAQGRPWIFREVAHFLPPEKLLPPPCEVAEVKAWLIEHLHDHYALYGEAPACAAPASTSAGRCVRCRAARRFRAADEPDRRLRLAAMHAVGDWFDALADVHTRLPAPARHANDDPDASNRLHESKKHIEQVHPREPRGVLQGPARRRADGDVRHDPARLSRSRCSK